MQGIDEAYERMLKSNAKYRLVVDMDSLLKSVVFFARDAVWFFYASGVGCLLICLLFFLGLFSVFLKVLAFP